MTVTGKFFNLVSKYFFASSSLCLIIALLLLPSCGKKSAPTLKSLEKPPAPSLLSVVHKENSITLSWTFRNEKETSIAGFSILRSSGEGFKKIAEIGASERNYSDTDFSDGLKYGYKLVSQSTAGILSVDSNIIGLTPQKTPGPPKKISFKVSDDGIILSWEGTEKTTMYNIYKSYSKGVFGNDPVNKIPLTENSFKDKFDASSETSYYTVRGLINSKTLDEGPSSDEISVGPGEFVPKPPADVRYFAAADKVFLFWAEPSEKWITGFRVYRRTGESEYILLGETQIPTFLDRDKPESQRDYRIHAVGPVKQGAGTELKGIIFVPER